MNSMLFCFFVFVSGITEVTLDQTGMLESHQYHRQMCSSLKWCNKSKLPYIHCLWYLKLKLNPSKVEMHRVRTSSAVCVFTDQLNMQHTLTGLLMCDWCLCRFPARSQHTGGQQSKPSAPPSAAFQSAN